MREWTASEPRRFGYLAAIVALAVVPTPSVICAPSFHGSACKAHDVLNAKCYDHRGLNELGRYRLTPEPLIPGPAWRRIDVPGAPASSGDVSMAPGRAVAIRHHGIGLL